MSDATVVRGDVLQAPEAGQQHKALGAAQQEALKNIEEDATLWIQTARVSQKPRADIYSLKQSVAPKGR